MGEVERKGAAPAMDATEQIARLLARMIRRDPGEKKHWECLVPTALEIMDIVRQSNAEMQRQSFACARASWRDIVVKNDLAA